MLPSTRATPRPAKLKPVAMNCDEPIAKDIPPPLPQSSFRMLIVAAPGHGKTSLATSLIIKGGPYYKKFDRVWVIQPNNSRGSYAKDPWAKHSRVFDDLTPDLLQDIIEQAKKLAEDGKHSLVMIDDFAYTLKDKHIERKLREIYFNSRHLKLSSVVISQTLRSVPDKLRKSASHLIAFTPANRIESRIIQDELLFIDPSTAAVLFDQIFQNSYDFMLIDTQRRRVFRNLETEIELPRAF